MLQRLLLHAALAGSALSSPVFAQAIYRCGHEYTNDALRAQQRGCTVLESLPVTVPAPRLPRPAASLARTESARNETAVPAADRSETRPDATEQRQRDTDARAILAAELRQAEARLAELQTEFNQGAPERLGSEVRQPQRYQARVQVLREALVRQQSDIASLRRELARLPAMAANP